MVCKCLQSSQPPPVLDHGSCFGAHFFFDEERSSKVCRFVISRTARSLALGLAFGTSAWNCAWAKSSIWGIDRGFFDISKTSRPCQRGRPNGNQHKQWQPSSRFCGRPPFDFIIRSNLPLHIQEDELFHGFQGLSTIRLTRGSFFSHDG